MNTVRGLPYGFPHRLVRGGSDRKTLSAASKMHCLDGWSPVVAMELESEYVLRCDGCLADLWIWNQYGQIHVVEGDGVEGPLKKHEEECVDGIPRDTLVEVQPTRRVGIEVRRGQSELERTRDPDEQTTISEVPTRRDEKKMQSQKAEEGESELGGESPAEDDEEEEEDASSLGSFESDDSDERHAWQRAIYRFEALEEGAHEKFTTELAEWKRRQEYLRPPSSSS